jgi:hypothetical protein
MAQERGAGGVWRGVCRPASRRSRCPRAWALTACVTLVALAGVLVASRALADTGIRLAVDWEKLGALLSRDDGSSHESWQPEAERPLQPTRLAEPLALLDGAQGSRWWSLVAHDWEGSRLLMGRLTPTDEVKRWRSKRMVMLRGRFADGPVAPYGQVGLGQWRIDPDIRALPHDAMLAAQVGAGVELALASWVSLAFEADCTFLDPGRLDATDASPPDRPDSETPGRGGLPPEARWVHPPALWGTFLAARAQF